MLSSTSSSSPSRWNLNLKPLLLYVSFPFHFHYLFIVYLFIHSFVLFRFVLVSFCFWDNILSHNDTLLCITTWFGCNNIVILGVHSWAVTSFCNCTLFTANATTSFLFVHLLSIFTYNLLFSWTWNEHCWIISFMWWDVAMCFPSCRSLRTGSPKLINHLFVILLFKYATIHFIFISFSFIFVSGYYYLLIIWNRY